MTTDRIREIWPRFDDLIEKAESPDTKLLIEALRLHAELLNLRLSAIDNNTSAQARVAMRQSGFGPG